MVGPEPSNVLGALLQIALGLVLGFAGYRLADGVAGLFGFLSGAVLGFGLGTILAGPIGGIVAAIVLGIGFALLAAFALRVLAALLAGGVAWLVATGLGLALPWAVLAAIVAGALGLMAHRVVLIVATALLGAVVVASAIRFLLPTAGISDLVELGVALGLAAVGAVVQWRALKDSG